MSETWIVSRDVWADCLRPQAGSCTACSKFSGSTYCMSAHGVSLQTVLLMLSTLQFNESAHQSCAAQSQIHRTFQFLHHDFDLWLICVLLLQISYPTSCYLVTSKYLIKTHQNIFVSFNNYELWFDSNENSENILDLQPGSPCCLW